MAPRSRGLPLLLAAICCAALLRSLFRGLGERTFVAPKLPSQPSIFISQWKSFKLFGLPYRVLFKKQCELLIPGWDSRGIHPNCRALSGGALASGQMPAVIQALPARPGVPAHFKVTMQTPDGSRTFEARLVVVGPFGILHNSIAGFPLSTGPWNQKLRSLCLCALLAPFGDHEAGSG